MKYNYVCPVCHKIQVLEQSITKDLPNSLPCEWCSADTIYDVNQLKDSMTIVPDHMKSDSPTELDFSKLKREERRYL